MKTVATASLLLACMFYADEGRADAAGSGRESEMPAKLTLLSDTPIYEKPFSESEPVGIIAAYQSVPVTESTGMEQDAQADSAEAWYPVLTWLGEKWLQAGPAVVNGDYYPVRLELALTGSEDLYDLPAPDRLSGAQLSPQTVTATGQLFLCYADIPVGDSQPSAGQCGPWYRIRTYLGDRWIRPAAVSESYEDPQAAAAYTPLTSYYQMRLRSIYTDLFPVFETYGVEFVSLVTEVNTRVSRLEVRRLYRHREPLSGGEKEALKRVLFDAVGGPFPLVISTFTLAEKADFTGIIMSLDKTENRVLVVNYDIRAGTEPPMSKAYWIRLTRDANIHRKGKTDELNLNALRIGQTVEVWLSGFAAASYPGQTGGYEIAIVEDPRPGEEGVSLGTILGIDLNRIDKIELEFGGGSKLTVEAPDIVRSITERMRQIRLQAGGQYQDSSPYTMTVFQGERKAVYPANLVISWLFYKPTTLTLALDEFIMRLKDELGRKAPAN